MKPLVPNEFLLVLVLDSQPRLRFASAPAVVPGSLWPGQASLAVDGEAWPPSPTPPAPDWSSVKILPWGLHRESVPDFSVLKRPDEVE